MLKLQKSSLILILIIVVLTAGCVSIYTLGYAPGTVSHKAEDVKSGTFGSNVGSGNYNFPGNVGIKKTNPTSQLDVTGNIYTTGQVTAGTKVVIGGSSLTGTALTVASGGTSSIGGNLNVTGNVGIGTTNPTDKLEVVGNITSKGTSWTAQTVPNGVWNGVTYGNGLFVAVGANYGGGSGQVMTSPDGINWTLQPSSIGGDSLNSVTYGNGLFVAVRGGNGGAMTSPDGINWTARSTPGGVWTEVTYGNGLFVAVGGALGGGSGLAMTSPDGINWTARSTPVNSNRWNGLTYGNGLFVATATNKVMTSPDGINWTARTVPNGVWTEVTYGNGLFVAIANYGPGAMTSPDGINWTARTIPGNFWFSVTYGNGLFVATGESAAMTSPDGINWTVRTNLGSLWFSVTYGNGLFVATGESAAMTSGKTETTALSHNNIYQGGLSIMSGNVGIGTASPQAKLEVNGAIKVGTENTCNANTAGAIRYNLTSKLLELCNGTNWAPPTLACMQVNHSWGSGSATLACPAGYQVTGGGWANGMTSGSWDSIVDSTRWQFFCAVPPCNGRIQCCKVTF